MSGNDALAKPKASDLHIKLWCASALHRLCAPYAALFDDDVLDLAELLSDAEVLKPAFDVVCLP